MSRCLSAKWLTGLLEPNVSKEYCRNSCVSHMPQWLSASSRTLSCLLQLTGTLGPQPTRLWRSVPLLFTNYKLPHYCTLCLPSSVPCSPLSLHGNVSTNTSSNAPRTSANVSMNTSSTAPGVIVQFFCTNGGKLSGNAVISCLQNGSWSGSVPSCVNVMTSTGR